MTIYKIMIFAFRKWTRLLGRRMSWQKRDSKVMTVGADYGVRMIYDYNVGGNACSLPIEFTR
jgi:hypothetical protein